MAEGNENGINNDDSIKADPPRGVGKPAKYGKRSVHSVRVADDAWPGVLDVVQQLCLDGVAELLIWIGYGWIDLTVVPEDENELSEESEKEVTEDG